MSSKRIIELDILRTIAIIGMVVYHTAYDLQFFYGWRIDVFSGGWKLFQLSIACLFLVLVGVSAAIADIHITTSAPHMRGAPTPCLRAWKRFARIGMAALLVTIATYIVNPETYVRFGILHLIAVSALLLPMIASSMRRRLIAILTIIIGTRSLFIHPWHINGSWRIIGIPLGIRPEHFITVDYFPLIPWFGVILMGYIIGDVLYKRLRAFNNFSRSSQLSVLAAPGRHSLLLYLIHQPIILAILWIALRSPQS